MKILVIAPHPDDEVLGVGGTMARHVANGDHVHVLVVTRGIPELFSPAQVDVTRNELRKANKILGVSAIHFLDFPAPKLDGIPMAELAGAVGTVVKTLRPSTIYLPHGGDLHGDHRAVHEAVLVAARPIDNCSVRRLLAYETLSETEWGSPVSERAFLPVVFVDIERYLRQKLAAIACYRSQIRKFPHPRSLPAVRALARLRGSATGLRAAEGFGLVREVIE